MKFLEFFLYLGNAFCLSGNSEMCIVEIGWEISITRQRYQLKALFFENPWNDGHLIIYKLKAKLYLPVRAKFSLSPK